jgi:tetratricopeptide (TPR) repeat protein
MEQVYQQAIRIQEKYLDPHDDALSNTLLRAASLYVEVGEPEKSLPIYQQALELTERKFGIDDARLLPTLDAYAVALHGLGRTDESNHWRARADAIRGGQLPGIE